jgi:hypothetical protein
MIFAEIIGGDYFGQLEVRIGALWFGSSADKFKGISIVDDSKIYKAEEIQEVIQLSVPDKEKAILRYCLKLTDDKKIIIEQKAKDKALKCLQLYAIEKDIFNQDFTTTLDEDKFDEHRNIHFSTFRESQLEKTEKIVVWATGSSGMFGGNGALIVTKDKVIFYRKSSLGDTLESIPLKNITSLKRNISATLSTISIYSPNKKLSFNTFGDNGKDQELVNAIEAGREDPLEGEVPPEIQSDPIDILKKLKELKDVGVITEEEFNDKKSELLTRM